MAESKSHRSTAIRIAAKYKTEYNSGDGIDINAPDAAIEVETAESIGNAGRQLQGHRKPVFVAVTTQKDVEAAKARYKGTTIGVLDNQGEVVVPSTRRGRGAGGPKRRGRSGRRKG